MSKNSSNKLLRIPLFRKLRRLWSIPLVRIIAFLVAAVLVITVTVSVFKGCGNEQSDVSDTSEESLAESSDISATVSEEISTEPVIALPEPWIYSSSVDDISSSISSDYGIIINATTREVLGGKNYTQRIYPASMTKIMTLIVAVESGVELDAEYTMSYILINKYYLAEASMSGIYAGDTVSFKDLLYGAILLSAADATAAIADMVAGGEEAYVELMNLKAKEIGCTDTNFTNTSGLHNTSNYSTVGDIALMLDYAMSIPLCKEILSEDVYYTPSTPKNEDGYKFFSTMFTRIDYDTIPGMTVVGGKTGYLAESRHCLASMAVSDSGEQYIVVTAGARVGMDAIYDCINLYSTYSGESNETS